MLGRARIVASAVGLAMGLVVTAGASSAGAVEAKTEVHPEWGRTSTKAHKLKFSCRNYRYSYAITPPKGEWGLETFLVGPGGVHLASGAIVVGLDPLVGSDKFRFCSQSTRRGVFRIKALLSVQDESGRDYQQGWLPVTKFRLR